jgi:hypothetical protein
MVLIGSAPESVPQPVSMAKHNLKVLNHLRCDAKLLN